MLWTGLAIRSQLRRPVSIAYIRNALVTTMLFTLRGASRSLQDASPTSDERGKSVGTPQKADTSPNSFLGVVNSPRKKKCRRPRSRAKPTYIVPDDSIVEHIKTHRPRIKPVKPREAVSHSWNSRKVWKVDPRYRIHVRDKTGPLYIMSRTNSPTFAWDAYRDAVNQSIHIPTALLDRIFGVLIRTYAPTRKTFLRLHEISSHLRNQGERLKQWQWNALIYHSALALRKVHTKDYQAALDVYTEMVSAQTGHGSGGGVKPDITTYTTLIYIAIRTGVVENVRHAYSLLRASNITPDRLARLAIIPYYIYTKKLRFIRGIALEFTEKRQDIGLDGINAYMWAFGRHGYLEVMEEVYQALRLNIRHDTSDQTVITPESSNVGIALKHQERPVISQPRPKRDMSRRGRRPPKEEIDDALAVLNWPSTMTPVPVTPAAQMDASLPSNEGSTAMSQGIHRVVNESLAIWNHHVPNHITYAICIQVYAFHGNYRRALQIFRDMITSNEVESAPASIKIPYTAMHKVYRALFLGFARVSRKFAPSDKEEARPSVPDEQEREWISNALEIALAGFLDMEPRQGRPNDRTVLWIMYAFSNITQGDTEKLIRVWRLLEERFGTLHVPYSFRQIAKAARKEDA